MTIGAEVQGAAATVFLTVAAPAAPHLMNFLKRNHDES